VFDNEWPNLKCHNCDTLKSLSSTLNALSLCHSLVSEKENFARKTGIVNVNEIKQNQSESRIERTKKRTTNFLLVFSVSKKFCV